MIVTQTVSLDSLNERYGECHADPSAHLFVEEVHALVDLRDSLSLLTPRQQLIVLLKMTGFTGHREIARLIGSSVSLVELEMKRIRATLSSYDD